MSSGDAEHERGQAATLLDQHIGARIRARRLACGIAESSFSNVLSISEQDLQRWESGQVRPPDLNLLEIANLLSVHVDYFFKGLPGSSEHTEASSPKPRPYR